MKKNIIFVIFLFFSGCNIDPFENLLLGPIITGITVWHDEEAVRYYNEEPKTLHRAAKTALRELNIPFENTKTLQNGNYISIIVDNGKFKITIRRVKPSISEIKIRINSTGDKSSAESIYGQIDLNTNSIEFNDQGLPTKNRSFNKPSVK